MGRGAIALALIKGLRLLGISLLCRLLGCAVTCTLYLLARIAPGFLHYFYTALLGVYAQGEGVIGKRWGALTSWMPVHPASVCWL